MNKAIHMGRLTKDPEIRYSSDNKAVARFSLAVDRKFKREGQPDADFFNYTAFGKQAEFIEKYLKKGTKVVVVGQLQNNNWEKDGVKHYDVQIMVDEVEFAESKSSSSNTAPAPAQTDADGFMQVDISDELPFS